MSATPRDPTPIFRSRPVIAMAASLGLSAGCFVATGAAQEEPVTPAGRWVQETPRCEGAECPSMYDFVPCGEGWCGIEVKGGKDCGRIAFRLAPDPHPGRPSFIGQFERAPGTEVYSVFASVRAPSRLDPQPAPSRLVVYGNTGGQLEIFRRTWPLNLVMTRQGAAQCKGAAKTS